MKTAKRPRRAPTPPRHSLWMPGDLVLVTLLRGRTIETEEMFLEEVAEDGKAVLTDDTTTLRDVPFTRAPAGTKRAVGKWSEHDDE